MTTADAVLSAARSQLGYREGSDNDTKFGQWYGLNHNPWCAMFVAWCAHQAGADDIIPKVAYCPSGVDWFKARNAWHTTPKVGDVVYFEWPGLGRAAHTGLVEAVHPDGSVTTIEGNTNVAGAREGIGVMRQRRRRYILGYGRPAYTRPAVKPAKLADTRPLPAADMAHSLGARVLGPGDSNPYTAAVNRFVGCGGQTYTANTVRALAAWAKVAKAQGSPVRTDGRCDAATMSTIARAVAYRKAHPAK